MTFFKKCVRYFPAVLVMVCINLIMLSLYGYSNVKTGDQSHCVNCLKPQPWHLKEATKVIVPTEASTSVAAAKVIPNYEAESILVRSQNESESIVFSLKKPVDEAWSLDQMDSFRGLMKDRKQLLSKTCDSFRHKGILPRIRSSVYRNLIIMKERKILWCPVFKASSTTWLHYLLDISSLSKIEKARLREKYKNAPLNMISKFTFRPVSSVYERYSKEVKEIKSFIIVRHPFTRLVSAFRDKIERYHTPELKDDFYYKVYGAPIVNRFRKAALKRFGPDFFSEANHFGAPLPVSNGRRNAKLPTFWEFVQYVKACRVSRMDEHFRPIYDFCSPCDINYETVIHFENLSEESKYLKGVLDPFGATSEAQIEWANPNPTGLKVDELTRMYFQTLSPADIMALYKIYELDMKMFGYSFHMKNITLPRP